MVDVKPVNLKGMRTKAVAVAKPLKHILHFTDTAN